MADGGHFENGFIAISQPEIMISMKFGVQKQTVLQGQSHDKVSKFSKFKMADGCHTENRFFLWLHPSTLLYD